MFYHVSWQNEKEIAAVDFFIFFLCLAATAIHSYPYSGLYLRYSLFHMAPQKSVLRLLKKKSQFSPKIFCMVKKAILYTYHLHPVNWNEH